MIANGTILNDTYVIREQIGSGGGGIIYKAWHRRLGIPVVVKELKDEARGRIDARGEADVLKRLRHTYLPGVYDFLEVDGGIYTVMDFIEGVNLKDAMHRHGYYPEAVVYRWALQLSEALEYLHSRKPPIIHSDIKPSNIMLRPNGDICLIDFNISLALSGDGHSTTGISGGYAPPEQYRDAGSYLMISSHEASLMSSGTETGSRITAEEQQQMYESARALQGWFGNGVDTRSDIYSLGATLFHLLTGVRPSGRFDRRIPVTAYDIPLSEGFGIIINRMMALNPAERYRDGRELHHALLHIRELDSSYRRKRQIRRTVTALILGGMFCAAGIGAFAVKTARDRKEAGYRNAVRNAYTALKQGDFEEAEEGIESALAAYPDRAGGHAAKTQSYYRMGDYESCVAYGVDILDSGEIKAKTETEEEYLADICCLVGNAYYEMEEYDTAGEYFLEAIDTYDEQSIYYRDLALARAKAGDTESALENLEKGKALGLPEDSVMLTEGEIAFVRGEYDTAREKFDQVLRTSADEELIGKCVMFYTDLFRVSGQENVGEEIAFLEKWRNSLAARKPVLTGRLAETYARAGQYEQALACYQTLKDQGLATYRTSCNMAILYQESGRLGEAESTLQEMLETWPGRYETYKRLAFLELDKQQNYPNQSRNYRQAAEYMEQARRLYAQSGASDAEMQMLEMKFEELRQGNWL